MPATKKSACPPKVVLNPLSIALTFAYGFGLSVIVIRLLWAGLWLKRLIRRSTAISHPALSELSARFGRPIPPPLLRSPEISSPLLALGAILLPEEVVENEPLILAHELAHLQRRDMAWEMLGTLTQTLFFFYPLVWLARYEERLAREQAADEWAIAMTAATPAEYAHVLLSASLRRSGQVPAFTVGVVESGSRLRKRLEALARPHLSRQQVITMMVLATTFAIPALLPWRAVARQENTTPASAAAAPVAEPSPSTAKSSSGLQGVMSGVITNREGKPVPNAKISWVVPYDPKPRIIAETTTDQAGAFVFEKTPGNTKGFPDFRQYWRLRLDGWVIVRASGYGLGVKRVRYENRAVSLKLTPPQTYTATFRNMAGHPIAGLNAWAGWLENGHSFFPLKWLGFSGTTDARGIFTASGLPADDKVWFEFDRSHVSVAEESDTETGRQFTLGPGHTLEGTIRFPDGRPVARAMVQITTRNVTPFWTPGMVTSDDQGNYRFVGLGQGKYELLIGVYPAIRYVAPYRIGVDVPLAVEYVRKDVTLVRAAKVEGHVTDTTGKPMAGRWVGYDSTLVRTDDTGHYELTVPVGPLFIGIRGQAAQKINAQLDHPTVLDFHLPPDRIADIHGQVFDSRGEPVVGKSVFFRTPHVASGAITDSEGKFSWQFEIGIKDPVTVWIHQGNEGATVRVQPGDTKPLTLRLSEANVGYLIGRVTDAAGKPLPKAVISISEEGISSDQNRPTVDAEGQFRITTCVDLRCTVNAHLAGYGDRYFPSSFNDSKPDYRPEELRIKGGETKDLGTIVLTQGKDTATGRLLNEQKKSIPNAVIVLVTPSGVWMGKTDSNGRFTIPGVVRGETANLTINVLQNNSRHIWERHHQIVGEMGDIILGPPDHR
jgi:protocatechuate 3,4-dioxygenase beta subunit